MSRYRYLRRRLRMLLDQPLGRRVSGIAILSALLFAFEYWLILHETLHSRRAGTTLAPTKATPAGPPTIALPLGCDMTTVKRIALRYHLTPLLGQPVDTQVHGTLSIAQTHLVVTGSFDQLQNFVTALHQHPSTFTIDNIQLALSNRQQLDLHAHILCLRLASQEEMP